jgi:hypothetical protein
VEVAAYDSQTGEDVPQIAKVPPVLLSNVEIRIRERVGRNATFGVKVAPCIVYLFLSRF